MNKTKAEFKKKERGLSGGKRIAAKIATVAVSILALFLTYMYLSNADSAARDTVPVVRVKNGIPAYTILTKDDVEKYDLIKKEFIDKEMILYENAEDEVYGKYTAYFIRGKTVLYSDQLIGDKPVRNEWLYSLSGDEEVVTIPYKYSEAGGDILLPGDLIRIRVSYEVEVPIKNNAGYNDYGGDNVNPNSYSRGSGAEKIVKTDILFGSIVVKDMINSNGRSVYELYKEVMRLDEKQRDSVMRSSEFLSSIKPNALLLAGTADDMERYATFKATVNSSNFLITILSRASNTIGFDNLPTLETEVRSWIDGGK
ncbi:MAG: hypothetical protein FWH52_02450 [Synergistaceae bacterium]|nr:hypothetical protein [Synergistaceae bacterium]